MIANETEDHVPRSKVPPSNKTSNKTSDKTTRLILNPQAGSAAKNRELLAGLHRLDDVDLIKTDGPGDAEEMARAAAEAGFERVIAAGGDGTVNEVLNGLADHLDRVTFGVLPLGTGNDLARSLGLPDDPELALNYLLSADDARQIDVMQVTHPDGSRLGLNHVNAGYSHMITESITPQMKQRWGPFAYLRSAASQLREREEYHTRLRWDDGAVEVVDAVNVLVANGRTVAGGLRVAPDASMEDGAIQVVVLRAGTLVELAGMAARLLVGSLLESDQVISRRARSIHIESTPPMVFSVDGEEICEAAVDVRVVPGALRAIVGPNYVVEPALDELDVDEPPPSA